MEHISTIIASMLDGKDLDFGRGPERDFDMNSRHVREAARIGIPVLLHPKLHDVLHLSIAAPISDVLPAGITRAELMLTVIEAFVLISRRRGYTVHEEMTGPERSKVRTAMLHLKEGEFCETNGDPGCAAREYDRFIDALHAP